MLPDVHKFFTHYICGYGNMYLCICSVIVKIKYVDERAGLPTHFSVHSVAVRWELPPNSQSAHTP